MATALGGTDASGALGTSVENATGVQAESAGTETAGATGSESAIGAAGMGEAAEAEAPTSATSAAVELGADVASWTGTLN
jgi:hypothetical protein